MRTLLAHDWARDYAQRPGVTVVDTADDVFADLQRLASEPAELTWA
jgi:DNA processing protein